MNSPKKSRGFTLIELLVALAIVAIIAGIAVPSYQEQLRKSRRSDAVVALTDLANRLERHYSEFNAYPANATEINAFLPSAAADSPQGNYTLSFVGVGTDSTATTYKIKATRKSTSPQANDTRCGDYTLTDTGARAVTGSGTLAQCWPIN